MNGYRYLEIDSPPELLKYLRKKGMRNSTAEKDMTTRLEFLFSLATLLENNSFKT